MASGAMARNSVIASGSRMRAGCATRTPSAWAAALTGGCRSSRPRPAGRSGWVTTTGISCPAPARAFRVGTAKADVPIKMMRTEAGRLGADQLALGDILGLDLAEGVQAGQAIDEEDAVDVIDLVLEGPR